MMLLRHGIQLHSQGQCRVEPRVALLNLKNPTENTSCPTGVVLDGELSQPSHNVSSAVA